MASRYPGGALASNAGSMPAPRIRRRKLDTYACSVVRDPSGGRLSHAESISVSILTGRLALMTITASTARCFGVPNGTNVPPMLICNGPNTPKSTTVSVMAVQGPLGDSLRIHSGLPRILMSPGHRMTPQQPRAATAHRSQRPPGHHPQNGNKHEHQP